MNETFLILFSLCILVFVLLFSTRNQRANKTKIISLVSFLVHLRLTGTKHKQCKQSLPYNLSLAISCFRFRQSLVCGHFTYAWSVRWSAAGAAVIALCSYKVLNKRRCIHPNMYFVNVSPRCYSIEPYYQHRFALFHIGRLFSFHKHVHLPISGCGCEGCLLLYMGIASPSLSCCRSLSLSASSVAYNFGPFISIDSIIIMCRGYEHVFRRKCLHMLPQYDMLRNPLQLL